MAGEAKILFFRMSGAEEMNSFEDEEDCEICDIDITKGGRKIPNCEICKKICCVNCLAIMSCKRQWGICIKCFDYKCRLCSKDIPKQQYLLGEQGFDNICEINCIQ